MFNVKERSPFLLPLPTIMISCSQLLISPDFIFLALLRFLGFYAGYLIAAA